MNVQEARPGWKARLDNEELAGEPPADPLSLFAEWFRQASEAELIEPTAMTLATADAAGRPSARVILLKGFDADGFRFYTNLESRKAGEIAANPHAAAVFWWDRLERQVRIEGALERLPANMADDYFASRPRGSQLGAYASPQSRAIGSRKELEQSIAKAEKRFEGRDVPRPDCWGGYRLRPSAIEFWQGRGNRLHDRLRYSHRDNRWQCERLAP